MKSIIAILAFVALITSYTQNTIDFEKLYGNWYMKQILVDGKEDPKNFPVNNDEINFKRDMTLVTQTDTSTWKIERPNKFITATAYGPITFIITTLSTEELEIKMIVNKLDIVIKYGREK